MPSINMIAPRRAEKKRVERDMRRLLAVILVELIFAVGLGGLVCTKIITTRSRINKLEGQLRQLQPIVTEIRQYESATARLTPKVELLNQAKTRTMRWYNTLDLMTKSLPAQTWLTHVGTGTTQNDSAVVLRLNGISASQSNVGEAMIRLQANQDFDSVDLHYTQNASLGQVAAIEFEIGASMKEPDEAKGVTKSGTSQS